MKLTQLVPDGQFLRYKGNWVTDTAYSVNDCVTWTNDGHLYEVIKAHTSSASFDPDNPEYYQVMTTKKWQTTEFSTWNAASRNTLLNIVKKNADALIRIVFEGALAYIRAIAIDDESCVIGGIVKGINATSLTSTIYSTIVKDASGSSQYFTGFGVGTDGTVTPINQLDVFIQAVIYTA